MKKIFILIIFISTFSCSTSDDTPHSYTEFLPIETVSMPDEFIRNITYEINLTYYKPSTCHRFNSIYYAPNANENIIAIVNEVFTTSDNCQEIMIEAEASFEFKPTELGTYVFKFWQGEDTNGQDHYYIVEAEVEE